MRAAYLEGRSTAALARENGVSRGGIRTAVADLLPEHTVIEEDTPVSEQSATLDMPGKVADFLRTTELEPADRAAFDQGTTVPRGQAAPCASPPSPRQDLRDPSARPPGPAPVIAKALGYHDKTVTRLITEAGGTWSRYAPGDHRR
ncbi:hypothetical protein ACFVJM_36180 [Streptomyces virginiae]|uniref:hypothetical protein n=1 Tax=Streptomyces virginiae TaxID=1961 RepID=UPI00363ED4D4